VRIFNAELDFGAGFAGQVVWVNGLGTGWDGTFATGIASARTWGLDGPRAPSVILIRAAGSGMVKVKALEPSGTVVTSQTLAGAWGAFELSPGRGYLAAQLASVNTQQSAVFRVSNGQMVWQGSAWLSGFSPDDRRLVYFPSGTSYKLPNVVDLQTGAEIAATSALITSPAITTFQLLAVLDQRAVISTSWQNYGMLLWTVDWQGRVAPFKSDMPMFVSETLQAFDPAGTKAAWSRTGNGTGGASGDLGAFEIDLATNASTSWSGPDFSCFGRPGQIAFRIAGNAVQSCNCGDGTCRDIATLPVLPRDWVPRLRVSADRRTVVVIYEWQSAMAPTNPPEILCLRASGEVIARVPWGMADMDETGQMLLVHGPLGPMASQIGIVNLVAGTATWIDRALRAMIVYE
jgi:hypothetical protein